MRIIDAQLHGVGPWADWAGDNVHTQHKILTELAIAYMDAVGVQGAVLFPGGDEAEAAWAAEQLPARFSWVPHISPDVPNIEAAVATAKKRQKDGLVGLRSLIGWPLDGTEMKRFEAGAWDSVYAACETHRVPLFLFITGWLPRAEDMLKKFPRLTVVIDHLGLRQPPLDQREDPPLKLLPQLLELAKFPNAHVKLCGLPSLSREAYPYKDVAPALRAVVDAFGADRLMWASDTTRFAGRIGIVRYQNPVTQGDYPGKHTYAEALHFIRDSDVLSAREKEAILGGTARNVLGLRG